MYVRLLCVNGYARSFGGLLVADQEISQRRIVNLTIDAKGIRPYPVRHGSERMQRALYELGYMTAPKYFAPTPIGFMMDPGIDTNLCMDDETEAEVLRRWPGLENKTHNLAEYGTGERTDVVNPIIVNRRRHKRKKKTWLYDEGMPAYRESARQIQLFVVSALERMVREGLLTVGEEEPLGII